MIHYWHLFSNDTFLGNKHDTECHQCLFWLSLTVCSWLSRFGELWKGRWFIFGSQSFLLGARFAPSGTCTVMFTQMSLMYHPPVFPPLPHHFSLLHRLWSVAIHPCDYHFVFCSFLPFLSPPPPPPPSAFLALIKPGSCPRGLNCLPNG